MKTQLDFLKEAVELAEKNPHCMIYFATSDERCEDTQWTQQHITKIKKTLYVCEEERIFTDIEDYVYYLKEIAEEEFAEEEACKRMVEAILIYTAS